MNSVNSSILLNFYVENSNSSQTFVENETCTIHAVILLPIRCTPCSINRFLYFVRDEGGVRNEARKKSEKNVRDTFQREPTPVSALFSGHGFELASEVFSLFPSSFYIMLYLLTLSSSVVCFTLCGYCCLPSCFLFSVHWIHLRTFSIT